MTIEELNKLRDLLHKLSVETTLTTEESKGVLKVIDVIKEVKKEAIEAEHTAQESKKEAVKAVKVTNKIKKVFNDNFNKCLYYVKNNGYNGMAFDRLDCNVKIINKSYIEFQKLLNAKAKYIKFKAINSDVTNDINALKMLKDTIINHREYQTKHNIIL